nr:hypothetical protein [Tanacetum cinerariifolium]
MPVSELWVNNGKSQAKGMRCVNNVVVVEQLVGYNLVEELVDCNMIKNCCMMEDDCHVDTYDSDCNDEATASAIFMESLSPAGSINGDTISPTYDSDIISEVPHYENYLENNATNSDVQETTYIEHIVSNNETCDELTSDSNVISYTNYMVTIENDVAQYVPPPKQNKGDMILSVIEQMKGQVKLCNKVNQEAKSMNESLTRLRTLQELLEDVEALKQLEEHVGCASKFAERIQELLVYVSASCAFAEIRNEK